MHDLAAAEPDNQTEADVPEKHDYRRKERVDNELIHIRFVIFAVDFPEPPDILLLPREHLDYAYPAEMLAQHGVDTRYLRPDTAVGVAELEAEKQRHDHNERRDCQQNQPEPPIHIEQHRRDADEHKQIAEQVDDHAREHLVQDIDIVGAARDQPPDRVRVEKLERQALQMPIDVVADIEQDVLPNPRHQIDLRVLRGECQEQNRQINQADIENPPPVVDTQPVQIRLRYLADIVVADDCRPGARRPLELVGVPRENRLYRVALRAFGVGFLADNIELLPAENAEFVEFRGVAGVDIVVVEQKPAVVGKRKKPVAVALAGIADNRFGRVRKVELRVAEKDIPVYPDLGQIRLQNPHPRQQQQDEHSHGHQLVIRPRVTHQPLHELRVVDLAEFLLLVEIVVCRTVWHILAQITQMKKHRFHRLRAQISQMKEHRFHRLRSTDFTDVMARIAPMFLM